VLLRHALERCDRDRLPAYLDATSPRNRALYARHGFEELGVIQAGSSPPMCRRSDGFASRALATSGGERRTKLRLVLRIPVKRLSSNVDFFVMERRLFVAGVGSCFALLLFAVLAVLPRDG
jgi:hypothetical protein